MTVDFKFFYLGFYIPPDQYKYIMIPVGVILQAIMDFYKLHVLIHNGHIYAEVQKGIHGLPQVRKLANNQLIEFLAPRGYAAVPFTAELWKHEKRNINFTLVVDDFGVKYTNNDNVLHLINTLKKKHTFS